MPYCLKCRCEYQPGFSTCADCGAVLVAGPPIDRPIQLVPLYTGRSIEARMLEETLRQRGIPSIVRAAEPLRGLIGDVALPMFEQVFVADADLESRRDAIDECLDFVRQGADLAATDEEDPA